MSSIFSDDGPADGPLIVMAHGAGAGSDSDFMQQLTELLVAQGCRVVRFDFPYMLKRRADGKKRPPDRAPVLLQAFRQQVEALAQPCVIAGKSMGGRMATLLAAEADCPAQVKGAAALGYPFHPPGKPESLRTAHLQQTSMPMLLVQGTRDAMGNREEVAGYALDPAIRLHWAEDGNHDLKPRKASGFSQQQHLQAAAQQLSQFSRALLR